VAWQVGARTLETKDNKNNPLDVEENILPGGLYSLESIVEALKPDRRLYFQESWGSTSLTILRWGKTQRTIEKKKKKKHSTSLWIRRD